MADAIEPTRSTPTVFDQLAAADQEMTVTRTTLHAACVELAAKNGAGDPIRLRIRQALFQVGTTRGSSR